jgi:AmpD protein
VDAVVLHHISLPPGIFGGPYVLDLFQNRLDPAVHPYFREIATLRVSCHFFLDRRGGVVQVVDTDAKAWHAGVSELEGRTDVNRFSIGIELEGDEATPFAEAQYEALEPLLRALRAAHPAITTARIVGHEHVAPGRKRDPGPLFDWERLGRWFSETLA